MIFARLKAWLGWQDDQGLHHDVLRAQTALFRLVRREGVGALAAHSDWKTSSILRRYARLGAAPGTAALLCEALVLLRANPDASDFEVQLDAWIEIAAARQHLDKSEPVVKCIRDATLALHRGARATQAIRIGRGRLPASDRLTTTNLTEVARDINADLPTSGC